MDATQPGTRDERILSVLTSGESSTVAIAAAAGLPERTVRAGLIHLRKEGLIVAPERGRYRLTGLGRTASEDVAAGLGTLRPAPAGGPPSTAAGGPSLDASADVGQPGGAGAGRALAALGVAALGVLAWAIFRPAPGAPPPPPPDPWAAYRRAW
jgi:hypothetical protein